MTTTISALGALPTSYTFLRDFATAINDLGQVAGYAQPSDSLSVTSVTLDAIVWQGNTTSTLATFPGESLAYPSAINDMGQVVGYVTAPNVQFIPEDHAVLWQNGSVTDLGSLGASAFSSSQAFGINNLGEVVGGSTNSSGITEAFLWQNGSMTTLGALPGVVLQKYHSDLSSADAINDTGEIVGWSTTAASAQHAVLWQNGVISDLGVLSGGSNSTASAINKNGLIVGGSDTAQGDYHAVQWLNGIISDLGTLAGFANSRAEAVNASGIIVGQVYNIDPNTYAVTTADAVIWQNGTLIDLNSLLPAYSGWVLTNAVGINSQDQVTGDGTFNGAPTEFIVTLGSTPLVGMSVQTALAAYKKGQVTSPLAITDSAANIQANLDALAPLAGAGGIDFINFSDSATPTLTVTDTQYNYTAGAVLAHLTGNYNIAITDGSAYVGSLEEFYSDSHVTSVSVSDSANQVVQGLDELQALVTSGRTVSVAMTDLGVPDLAISAAQLSSDAGALATISSPFTLTIDGSVANLTIAGLSGHGTTVQFSGKASQYSVTANGDGSLTVTDTGTGRSSVDRVSDVNALKFSDVTEIVAQTPGSNGAVTSGNITELYGAAFGRLPDIAGLAYYQSVGQANPTLPLSTYAQWFLASPEYTGNSAHNYAQTTAGDSQFIDDLYSNLLHRAPESGAVPFYLALIAELTQGAAAGTAAYSSALAYAHAVVLTDFSASAEFLGDVQVTAQNPASTQHWLLLV
jgi:probable HAF family extracellular repeat protein